MRMVLSVRPKAPWCLSSFSRSREATLGERLSSLYSFVEHVIGRVEYMGFRRGVDVSLTVEVPELMSLVERRAARDENMMRRQRLVYRRMQECLCSQRCVCYVCSGTVPEVVVGDQRECRFRLITLAGVADCGRRRNGR